MTSVTALSGGIASMHVARAAGAGVSRRAVVAHVGADNGGAVGFGASALLGSRVTSAPLTVGPSDRLSVIVEARGRGRRGGRGRGRGRGRRGGRVQMDRGPPRNEDIDLPEVRVMDEDKTPIGVMSSSEALGIAEEAGLDLVLMSPEANPPVCRIMNYSKYKYEQEKKQRETRKRAKATQVEVKELKMRYNIDTHDYGVRLKAAKKFLDGGDRVKVICQFRGRENDFRELGKEMFMRFCDDVGEDLGTLDGNPSMEGNRMVMMLSPVKEKVAKISKREDRQKRKREKAGEADDDEEDGEYEDDEDEEEEYEEEMEEEEIVLTKN